jgi:hypothetical protein
MDTNELIRAIAADARRPAMPMRRAWQIAVLAAVLLAASAFLVMLGPRHDLGEALRTIRFPFKFVVTSSLAVSALVLLRRLSRPTGAALDRLPLLLLAPALLALAIAAELLVVPPSQWMVRMIGTNSLFCLTFIPLIGIAPLATFLATLRYGAPSRPAIAGAVAGLLAGAVSGSFYALHCADDSPLFLAVWYTAAIAILAALGAMIAPRIAQW